MKAPLVLVLAASVGLAACQSDDITRPADTSMSAAAAGQQDLLTLVPQAALDNVQAGRLAAIRNRPSTAEVHLARIAAAPGQLLRQGSVLRLGVAPGLQVVATGEHATQRAAQDISWSGPIRGGYGWVQLVMMDGEVTATVTVGQTQYSIEPIGNGLHAVSKIDQSGFPPEHTPDNPSGALTTQMSDAAGRIQASRVSGALSATALTTINVMVVYTASAASAAGNITSKIQLAVDETNQSYANSGINISFNRVYTGQVTYSEAGRSFSQHVSALQSTTDGIMDNVHTLRNTYAADLVMLVVNDTEACGQAAAIKATASSAFATADQSCITGYYSFGHELGHLQGARHDRFVDGTLTPYQYGHGYIPSTKNWRTIMAYGNNCANCTRIQWWSNPLKTYPATGQVMGTTAYEDNARVLNLTAPTVAAFR
ncbi:M12 family metallo-peptidase [Longimicrobium sp.]|uniref:M12 family metallo-peptidase n=1 Tax=Longimicrobium sp. TaxID=2029185 RepID=UPI002B541956|nr:M12 family metallo-peptidase [Longimicrobium sp.]HSU15726.1 M12 family metallo-peptidase [Longimicrobium sp.]